MMIMKKSSKRFYEKVKGVKKQKEKDRLLAVNSLHSHDSMNEISKD